MARTALRLVTGALAAVLFLPAAARAQNQAPPAAVQPAAKPKPANVKDAAALAPAPGSDAALKKRVEQLEEQLVDLQVVIGTLESLAKAPQGSASQTFRAPASESAGDQARIDGIEMQIRALTQQMEQLSAEVRRATGKPADAASLAPPSGSLKPDAAVVGQPASPAPARSPSAANDPISGILSEPLPPADPAPGAVAALTPSDDPKLAYEAAYGHMLQQDYGAAQAGFGDFLKRFPSHALVPNALYWLGETYYVQKKFTDASEAFDIVLAAHGSSNKAPDSQLKKAMSLSAQGKTADACGALRQLAVKYPNAPPHVKTKADSERRRAGCT